MPTSPTANIRTSATNANLLQDIVLAKLFVSVLRKDLVTYELGMMEQLPMRSGKNLRWQFFANPVAATTPLTEGTDPANSQALATTKVESTIQQYGDYFELSDFFQDVAHSGTKEEFVKAAAYAGRLTIDTLNQVELATTSTSVGGVTPLVVDTIRQAAQTLASANAKYHRASPGGQYYVFVGSPKACYVMFGEGNPAWSDVKTQAMSDNMNSPLKGTPAASAMYDCIVKRSSNIQISGGTTDVNFLIADDSFGISSLSPSQSQPEVIVVPATPSLASPLGMRGTIGWKASYAVKLFDSNRVCKVLSAT
jgi:N4-gp56 family major capsid protein